MPCTSTRGLAALAGVQLGAAETEIIADVWAHDDHEGLYVH